jgi:hypothetical protein
LEVFLGVLVRNAASGGVAGQEMHAGDGGARGSNRRNERRAAAIVTPTTALGTQLIDAPPITFGASVGIPFSNCTDGPPGSNLNARWPLTCNSSG